MKKEVNFSRVFPAYHPKKGEPTYFVEAILTQLGIDYTDHYYFEFLVKNNPKISELFLQKFFDSLSQDIAPKSHTIRSHKRPLKVGDYINPTCWADKPYKKTEEGFWKIKFAPDIEIKKVWDMEINNEGVFYLNGKYVDVTSSICEGKTIAENDGLSSDDMLDWFPASKPFQGKIICWNELIEY